MSLNLFGALKRTLTGAQKCAVPGFAEGAVELSHVRFTPKSRHVRRNRRGASPCCDGGIPNIVRWDYQCASEPRLWRRW